MIPASFFNFPVIEYFYILLISASKTEYPLIFHEIRKTFMHGIGPWSLAICNMTNDEELRLLIIETAS